MEAALLDELSELLRIPSVSADSAHFAFITPCSPEASKALPDVCVDAGAFDRVAFHKELNAAVLAFFRKHLVGK